jgi:hypothetical protein
MRRFVITLIGWLAIMVAAHAGTYVLTDGTRIVGTLDSVADKGAVFTLENGDFSPRIEWDRFTPDDIKLLMSEAKTDNDRQKLAPLFETIPQEVPKPKVIAVKPIQTPERPKQGGGILALFGSPVGWFILLVLYGANLLAAYEVCVYRHQPVTTVCGLAAIPFFGVLSPIIYGSMPTQYLSAEPAASAGPVEETATPAEPATVSSAPAPARTSAAPVSMPASAPVAAPAPAPVAALPEPIVFQKGDFSFNRRFFETKFAGFFRVIPSEAEKDLVLVFKASRGEFVGTRISKITPTELYLQVVNNNASADEMIPFAEIAEVQIRHKATL